MKKDLDILKQQLSEDETMTNDDKQKALNDLVARYDEAKKEYKEKQKIADMSTAASSIAQTLDTYSPHRMGVKAQKFEASGNPDYNELYAKKKLLDLGKTKVDPLINLKKDKLKAQIDNLRKDKTEKSDPLLDLKRDKLKAQINKLRMKSAKGDEKLTEAQKAADKAYGKDYADYIASGGSKVAESNFKKLKDISKDMDKNKDMFTGVVDKGTEYLGGFDTVRSLVNPRMQDLKDRLEQVIQQDLRATLGAQFAEREGRQFLERSFNPRLGYKENAKRLNDFMSMVESKIKARKDAAELYEKEGSIKNLKNSISLEGNSSPSVYSEGQERGIEKFMKKYNMDRNEAINVLTKAGRL